MKPGAVLKQLVQIVVVTLALLLSGCAATGGEIDVRPSPMPSVEVPEGAATLAQLGLTNGPTNFYLPADLKADDVIDQPNVVTFVLTPAEGKRVITFLAEHAEAMGWGLIGSTDDAVVMSEMAWRAEATTSDTQAALTLRRQ